MISTTSQDLMKKNNIRNKIIVFRQNLEESRKSKATIEKELNEQKTLISDIESTLELKIAVLNEKLKLKMK